MVKGAVAIHVLFEMCFFSISTDLSTLVWLPFFKSACIANGNMFGIQSLFSGSVAST